MNKDKREIQRKLRNRLSACGLISVVYQICRDDSLYPTVHIWRLQRNNEDP